MYLHLPPDLGFFGRYGRFTSAAAKSSLLDSELDCDSLSLSIYVTVVASIMYEVHGPELFSQLWLLMTGRRNTIGGDVNVKFICIAHLGGARIHLH